MRCRYGDLLLTAELLASDEPEYVRCEEPAAHLAIIANDDNGFVIEVTAPLCLSHEAHVTQNPGYKRSIKLRTTT
jgi:hypothetical protein